MVLKFHDKDSVVVKTLQGHVAAREVVVQTRFADFRCNKKQSADGVYEMWFELETRPAFEVALLRMGENGKPEIVVMRKKRLINDTPKEKLPGGYYDDSPDRETFRIAKVLRDTGIRMANLMRAGSLLGHGEIKLPIDFFYSMDWESETFPPQGVEAWINPLHQVVEWAMEGRIENDSSFSLIMRVDHLLRTGQIKL